ncbi:hypothetical protein KC333_g4050 [Hortaea werneckii]|nr:hypothetical protein KC333_g4050 [Hortaea werneckii]KAI7309737.1 hypothetical protein KC326_g6947 [Hortaea werneckii]
MSFATFAAAGLAAFSTMASGHLIMQNPVPFGVDSLNNSPLVDAKPGTAQSDFPCKQRPGVYDITAMNNVQVGKPNLISWEGSASHGGGTCQLAITTDLEPTANTTFKLIQTYEGNCPVVSSNGNTGTDDYTWSLPEGTPNGRLTFAWLWYNRIGNRELYMNCAPLDVTGGSDDTEFYDSLPNAYIVNMPTSECQVPETTNAEIPYPGQYLLKNPDASFAAASGPSCQASAAAMTEGVKGYKSATVENLAATHAPSSNYDSTGPATGAATQSAAPTSSSAGDYSASSAPAYTSTAATPTSAPSQSGFVTVSSAPASSSSVPATTSAPPASSSQPSAQTTTPSTSAAAFPSSSSSPGNTSCEEQGALICSEDGESYGLCNFGSAVMQPVAPGTMCSYGQIVRRPQTTDTPPGSVSCSEQGALVCSADGEFFGLCDFGSAVLRPVADGTTCSNGSIQGKRSLERRHAHRHRHGVHHVKNA